MSRETAIEAGTKALGGNEFARRVAEHLVDIVTPHLVGKPVGWAVMFDEPSWEDGVVYRRRDSLERDYPASIPGVRRCALIPVDEP